MVKDYYFVFFRFWEGLEFLGSIGDCVDRVLGVVSIVEGRKFDFSFWEFFVLRLGVRF